MTTCKEQSLYQRSLFDRKITGTEQCHGCVQRLLGVVENFQQVFGVQLPMRRNPANGYRSFRRGDFKRFLANLEEPGSQNRKLR